MDQQISTPRCSFITDEVSQDLKSCLQLASQYNIVDIELRSFWGRNILNISSDEVDQAAELLSRFGIGVSGLDTFIFKGEFDANAEAGLEMTKVACDMANQLDASFIRIFAFWKDGHPGMDAVGEQVSKAGEIAAQHGCEILVENGTFSSVGAGSRLSDLIEAVGADNVAALWDPGNVLNGGWEESVEDGFRSVAPHMRHVHVKNPHKGEPGHMLYGPVRGGMIDWQWQIKELIAMGYSGNLSLETHWRSETELRGRAALDFPEGEAFSRGGLEPTRSMLEELDGILQTTV